jgi:hypothetical protein
MKPLMNSPSNTMNHLRTPRIARPVRCQRPFLTMLAALSLPAMLLRAELVPLEQKGGNGLAMLPRLFEKGTRGQPQRHDAGFAVHIGCGDGSSTAALRDYRFIVHGLNADAAALEEARRGLQAKGVYGPVEIHLFDGRRLPYIDDLVNLIISDGQQVPRAEIDRVLAGEQLLEAEKPSFAQPKTALAFAISGGAAQVRGLKIWSVK